MSKTFKNIKKKIGNVKENKNMKILKIFLFCREKYAVLLVLPIEEIRKG